ncbi:MAG: TadE/TadG family type IV pilus assembly protein, partial [Bradymonadaceae bacterium]
MSESTRTSDGTGWIDRLAGDERGTALTEFVITLPVFVVIFSGLVYLGRLTHGSMEVRLEATEQMWSRAMDVQHGSTTGFGHPNHKMPPWAAGQALSRITGESRNLFVDYSMGVPKNIGMAIDGHFGESDGVTPPPVDAVAGRIVRNPGAVVGGTVASNMVVDDMANLMNPLPGPPSALSVFQISRPYSLLGPRPVGAAGIRYGLVSGQDSVTVDIPGGPYTMTA